MLWLRSSLYASYFFPLLLGRQGNRITAALMLSLDGCDISLCSNGGWRRLFWMLYSYWLAEHFIAHPGKKAKNENEGTLGTWSISSFLDHSYSIIFCHQFLYCVELLAGKNVVDVGCGVGFLGIACALLGAKKVALTDGNHDVLAMVQQNIAYSKNSSC